TRPSSLLFFLFMLRPPPRSPLFPYTTLFRSWIVSARSRAACGSGRGSASRRGYRWRDRRCARAACRSAGQDGGPRVPPNSHAGRSEEHTSELQSLTNLVCRLLLEKKKPTPPP